MTQAAEPPEPALPLPIFRISSAVERYMLYDINTITWLRKVHHILGVLIGTLPQIPQQNVFLGLPLELMPEEALLLIDRGLAYIVDDLEWHHNGMKATTLEQRDSFRRDLAKQGKEAADVAERKKLESTERAMQRLRLGSTPDRDAQASPAPDAASLDDSESLFGIGMPEPPKRPSAPYSKGSRHGIDAWSITPTTSYPPLPPAPHNVNITPPKVQISSYALFKHLHAHDYYMSPGLRFGCQYLVYPGDPLRFHSHFLAVGMDWDQDINLLDIVGGGRLGTGVKKGWLIGGVESREDVIIAGRSVHSGGVEPSKDLDGNKHMYNGKVRTFCIEWGGM